jgi:hypothetical protein
VSAIEKTVAPAAIPIATVAAITRLVTGWLRSDRTAREISTRRFFTELLLAVCGVWIQTHLQSEVRALGG